MSDADDLHSKGKDQTITLASARSAHYRQIEQRRVRRLVEASQHDTSYMDSVSDMMRLKAAHNELWNRIFIETQSPDPPAKTYQRNQDKANRRDRMRFNNRVHRQRQRRFVDEVEKHLIEQGRVLPESEYSRPKAPNTLPIRVSTFVTNESGNEAMPVS